ncbi:hypothetical protein ANN_23521 [Periplaneta americana]|uniref:Transposase Tc1-like domain-containing protein n=1 Tax=Periplaneta americana TaxID=6978 RepID=A0ABQ8SLB4_PERAM|nr:hypothetical protein ANN_23521 [Periplaneta americana]
MYLLWNRYSETGQFSSRVGQGRRRITTQNEDSLVISALRRRTVSARKLQQDLRRATGVPVSDQIVRNWLRERNLRPKRPVQVPRLTQQHQAARLLFARNHVNWQLRHWRAVLFTEESRFPLTQSDDRNACSRLLEKTSNSSDGMASDLTSMSHCEHDPKLQEYCVCPQNMPQFDSEGIPNQAPETNKPMILNGPTSRNREGSDQEAFDPSTGEPYD